MQKATAITGTEKQQTYIICLYSKREAKLAACRNMY